MGLDPSIGHRLSRVLAVHCIHKFSGQPRKMIAKLRQEPLKAEILPGDESALEEYVARVKAARGRPLSDAEVEEIQTSVRWFYEACIQQPPRSKRDLAKEYRREQEKLGNHLGSPPTALVRHRIAKARSLLQLDAGTDVANSDDRVERG